MRREDKEQIRARCRCKMGFVSQGVCAMRTMACREPDYGRASSGRAEAESRVMTSRCVE